MEEIRIFVKSNCDFCSQLIIPEELNIKKIVVDDESYKGHQPQNIPVLQLSNSVEVAGQGHIFINELLRIFKLTQDGVYKS